MPQYLTWDPVRGRWLFQRRVPLHAQVQLGNRTTIREHLGDIPRAEAVALAAQRAAYYQNLFAACAPTPPPPGPVDLAQAETLALHLDADNSVRFLTTWQMQQAKAFQECLDDLRAAPDEAWPALAQELRQARDTAREDFRRQDTTSFEETVSAMERTLHIRLDGSAAARAALVREFNSARVHWASDCLRVIDGEQSLSALFPKNADQLPLVELWGHRATDLAEHWAETARQHNGYVDPKTHQKYRCLAADLEQILTRRPVEALTPADLVALKTLWSGRGNGDGTIADKLDILKTLVRPFDPSGDLRRLLGDAHGGLRVVRRPRLALTDAQLGAFVADVFGPASPQSPDDQLLAALFLVTAARLEELCQLHAANIVAEPGGWLLCFADHRQTGTGTMRLKNSASARRLPVRAGVIPLLDAALADCRARGGALFPGMRPNRYEKRGDAASKRLNEALDRLFGDDRRIVLQGLRTTLNRVLRRTGIDARLRLRFLGHADSGIHQKHYDPGAQIDDQDFAPAADAIAGFVRRLFAAP